MTKRFRVVVLLVVFALLVLFSRNIEAEESALVTKSGTVTQLAAPATAYEQKDTSSKVIAEFSEGESVFITEADEAWTEIFYKGETGYIPTDQISNENMATAEKSAHDLGVGVTEEIKKNDLETSIAIDNYLRKQKQELNSLIWKVTIGVLVAAVFVVSIIIGIMNQNAIKEIESEKENNADDKNKKDEDIGNNDNSKKTVGDIDEKEKDTPSYKNDKESDDNDIDKDAKNNKNADEIDGEKNKEEKESDEVRKKKKRKKKRKH
ncbi:SH3 domain-containing protein [Butyrivibrio sp. AE2005]|uniref:SH3 domain-containing protein n=1 Tax=Butyrivibrio sp. AE2005 TaxID=1496722 RepID=UPI0004799B66|nr:hypothetical protein [Butyrivibrio sp. AE2005]